MIKLDINRDQLNDILKKLEPEKIEPVVKGLITKLAAKGKASAINNLKPRIKGRGTDYAQKSMHYRSMGLTAKVYSMMPNNRAMSIEEGREPGAQVSARAIARWYTGDLYTSKDWQKNASKLLIYSVYRTQAYIKQLGVKGKQFISKSREKLANDLPDELNKIAKKIESGWAK